MTTLLLAVLLSQQPVGNWLTRPEYQTYSAPTYYLQPDGGSDANACTSALAPCATPQAVVAKLPRFVRHNVTVTALGVSTLTAPVTFEGIQTADGVSITFQGDSNWTTWTPPSGTASGTLTGVTALSFPSRYILTDTGQSWPAYGATSNSVAMRGRFVCFTSGAAAGTKYPVAAHTATTLELAATPSPAPTAGTTYTLCTPSTVWTSTVTTAGFNHVRIGSGNLALAFSDMGFESLPTTGTSTAIPIFAMGSATNFRSQVGTLTLTRVRAYQHSIGTPGIINSTSQMNFTLSASALIHGTALDGASSGGVVAVSAGVASLAPLGVRVTASGSYVRSQRTAFALNGVQLTASGLVADIENVSASSSVGVSLNQSFFNASNTWIQCYSSSSLVPGITAAYSRVQPTSLRVDGCLTGIDTTQRSGVAARDPGSLIHSGTVASNLQVANNTSTSAFGVKLCTGCVADISGTYTVTSIADGGRDWVCPNGTEAYTDAQAVAATNSFTSCQGASIRR